MLDVYGGGNGANGTGGLLVIYTSDCDGTGSVTSCGSLGGTGVISGGSSGAGSINIFYTKSKGTANFWNVDVTSPRRGGSKASGGVGGTGTITKGYISNGTFIKE